MSKTEIGWADKNLNWYSWNCNKVSQGCKFCYAEALAKRYGKVFTGAPEWRENAIKDYRMLKAGDAVFVNTMSDTFHEGAPLDMIRRVFSYAAQRPDVTFLVLTKRIKRAFELSEFLDWHENLYLGTSVENEDCAWRIDWLRDTPAKHRFISFEPLLGSVGYVDLRGIDGVITGGESGFHRRPFNPQWALDILHQCKRDGATFFHKQGGAAQPGQDRLLNGRTYDELPWKVTKAVEVKQEVLL